MKTLYKRLLLALPAALAIVIGTGVPAFADETVGTISGRITTSTGAPAAFAQVALFHPSGIGSFERLADRDGVFQIDGVGAGDYKVQVRHGGVSQFAHRKLTFAEGDTFTVQAGANTVVDEQMFAPGAIEVKVVDAGDGRPVESACVTLSFQGPGNCTPENGVFRFSGLGQKSDYVVNARAADGLHMPGEVRDVAVELGKTTEVTVELDPAAVITTRVLDRASGEPVAFACVAALSTYFQGIQEGFCPESTTDPVAESADDGTVRIGEIPAGDRRLFVMPEDGVHGIQWVGEHGGTGSQYEALKIKPAPGMVTGVDPILLDPTGSLSGTFTDAIGGSLESNNFCATVMPNAEQGTPPGSTCGSSNGSFTIPNLGPYKWPVGIFDLTGPYGTQWPGSAKLDRLAAETFQVTSGTTTNIGTQKINKARQVRGAVLQSDGRPWPGFAFVSAFNARTGDFLGLSQSASVGYSLSLVEQDVKFRITAEDFGTYWYTNATSFTDGDAVHISGIQDTHLDIVVPAGR